MFFPYRSTVGAEKEPSTLLCYSFPFGFAILALPALLGSIVDSAALQSLACCKRYLKVLSSSGSKSKRCSLSLFLHINKQKTRKDGNLYVRVQRISSEVTCVKKILNRKEIMNR